MIDRDAALGHHLLEIMVAVPYRQYQRTAQSTISPSKWRPLKSDTAWLHPTSSHFDACRPTLQQSRSECPLKPMARVSASPVRRSTRSGTLPP
jgi:hypothetical protein